MLFEYVVLSVARSGNDASELVGLLLEVDSVDEKPIQGVNVIFVRCLVHADY